MIVLLIMLFFLGGAFIGAIIGSLMGRRWADNQPGGNDLGFGEALGFFGGGLLGCVVGAGLGVFIISMILYG